ncbi:MAG: AMP-binding protein [Polaromonas sp.]
MNAPNDFTPSAQTDRFAHERLPPPEQWPELVYSLPELRELQLAGQANLVDTLFTQALKNGHADRPMLRSEALTLSYAQARQRVNQMAQVLTDDLRLVPGNRVLLRGVNSIDMALAWLAVVQAGLIAVATMPLLRAKELADIIATARPALALCDAALMDELQRAQAQGAPLPAIVPFSPVDAPSSLAALAAAQDGHAAPCPTAADDIALMAFTSGTTGSPKAALHTHRDVLAACEAWPRQVLKSSATDIVVGTPPLAFTFGLGGLLLFPMRAGASVYFPAQRWTPEAMIEQMAHIGATICYTAPTFYRQMAPFASRKRPPALRLCVSAGESLASATRQLWQEASGIEILDGLGATEMLHIFISSAPGDVRPGAIGKVVPGYRARVVDAHGSEVPRGTPGRLAVQGPTGCRYLDDARQLDYVKNGWNLTGDVCVQDADGYFFYQSRADELIVTAGYNVAGPEIEDALLAHPAVAECGVVGVPDAARGSIVKAFVVLKPGFGASAAMVEALQAHVRATLAPYKYPRQIQFMRQLPRNESGKLQRFKLRQLADS